MKSINRTELLDMASNGFSYVKDSMTPSERRALLREVESIAEEANSPALEFRAKLYLRVLKAELNGEVRECNVDLEE